MPGAARTRGTVLAATGPSGGWRSGAAGRRQAPVGSWSHPSNGRGPPRAPAEGAFPVLNPLRSEREAFRFLVYVVIVAAIVIALVMLGRAVL